MEVDEALPNTLTPSSQGIQQPWGKLVPCLDTLETIVIDKQFIKIGRSVTCDIVIDKSKVAPNGFSSISKEHCVITRDPGSQAVYVTDLSKNGTFINGNKIGRNEKNISLKDGDKIAIGQRNIDVYVFEYLIMDELPDTLTSPLSGSPTFVQSRTLPTWGRLISSILNLDSCDLSKPTIKVGRSSHCDVTIDKMNIHPRIKNTFSKEHFLLFKDPDSSIACITDLSKSGTYLNGRLIGKNKRNILQNNDSIGLSCKKTVYVYKAMHSSDVDYLPPELRTKYELSRLLGNGGCGEVRLAYEKLTCKMYAIKKILKTRSTVSQMHKLNHPSKIHTEVKILASLSNPFVIEMKEIVETEEEVFIVLDYMRGGELNNRILSAVPLTESNIKFLFYQMVRAVEFLHSKGITHRDLKPENVLLASDDVETVIKVTDFGLSKITEGEDLMQTMCGTWNYIAPEVLNTRIPEYNRQVDVWSFGVILFYMLSKELPFKSSDTAILSKLILSGTYHMEESSWNGISYHAKDLVTKMLTVNPQKRITVTDILKHPWLAKDISLQYRLETMLKNSINSTENENISNTSDLEPPTKRVRLSTSDESTD